MIGSSVRRARGLWIGLLSFAVTAGMMLAAAPAAHAQQFSDSYNFLKAVKDADGAKATELAGRPGSSGIINTRDYGSGEGALHIVVKRRDLPWIAFMVQNGANPNLRDNEGNTPLIDAAQLGFTDGAQILLYAKAGVNIANSRGETPLILAVQAHDLTMVRLLLAAGADPKQTDHVAGLSARDYAARDSRDAAMLKILDAAPAVSKPGAVMGPTR